MKKILIRIFVELYHWQNDNWGASNLPILTSLLYLSALQFFNMLSLIAILDVVLGVNLIGFFGEHYYIGLILPFSILTMDYLIIRPVNITIEENPLNGRRITWIYVLATILVVALSVALIVHVNPKK